MGESETVGMSEQILHTIFGSERQAGGSTKAVQSLVMLSYSRSILLDPHSIKRGLVPTMCGPFSAGNDSNLLFEKTLTPERDHSATDHTRTMNARSTRPGPTTPTDLQPNHQ